MQSDNKQDKKMPARGLMFYLVKSDQALPKYTPMPYEAWSDLKSLEPGKFTLDYEDYIRLVDYPGYLASGSPPPLLLQSMPYDATTPEAKTNVALTMVRTEQRPDFDRWVPENTPQLILIP